MQGGSNRESPFVINYFWKHGIVKPSSECINTSSTLTNLSTFTHAQLHFFFFGEHFYSENTLLTTALPVRANSWQWNNKTKSTESRGPAKTRRRRSRLQPTQLSYIYTQLFIYNYNARVWMCFWVNHPHYPITATSFYYSTSSAKLPWQTPCDLGTRNEARARGCSKNSFLFPFFFSQQATFFWAHSGGMRIPVSNYEARLCFVEGRVGLPTVFGVVGFQVVLGRQGNHVDAVFFAVL